MSHRCEKEAFCIKSETYLNIKNYDVDEWESTWTEANYATTEDTFYLAHYFFM